MCGIAGIYKLNNTKVHNSDLERMTNIISHRGPDGFGYWYNSDGTLALGHRRLSILDLSDAGKQPFEYHGLTITFNGEIYNYLEIRKELIGKGYIFFTETDTEVLLALYHLKGAACLNDLDGMFSFAIWNENKKELFCARDRFGEKPFYYYYDQEKFIFGSEIKQIIAAGIVKEINPSKVYNYCLNGDLTNTLEPKETFFKNIFQLPNSSFLQINSDKKINIKKYWDISLINKSDITFDHAQEKFTELLSESIKRRLRSDVAVGTSLSGGLDSTTIASYICRNSGSQSLNSFTASFPGFEKDETNFIDIFKNRYKDIHDHYVMPNEHDLLADLDKLFYHHDEPIGSTSIYAQYRVMKLAKQNNVTVLLDGQGADEYLAGYNQFWSVRLRELYALNGKNYKEEKKKIQETTGFNLDIDFNLGLMLRYPALHKSLSSFKNIFIAKKIAESKSPFADGYTSGYTNNVTVNWAELNSVLYHSTFSSELQILLRYADRNSMSHSREIRLPFLYHKLVEFVFSLPSEYKMHNGWSKFLLRKSQSDFLPKEICWRREKVGYATPQSQWMKNSQMEDRVKESKRKLKELKILSGNFIEQSDNWKVLNLYNLFF